jgi:hypothetical protein
MLFKKIIDYRFSNNNTYYMWTILVSRHVPWKLQRYYTWPQHPANQKGGKGPLPIPIKTESTYVLLKHGENERDIEPRQIILIEQLRGTDPTATH